MTLLGDTVIASTHGDLVAPCLAFGREPRQALWASTEAKEAGGADQKCWRTHLSQSLESFLLISYPGKNTLSVSETRTFLKLEPGVRPGAVGCTEAACLQNGSHGTQGIDSLCVLKVKSEGVWEVRPIHFKVRGTE